MSETENFLKESGEALRPIAAEMLNAVVSSLNTLCGEAVSCGEPSVTAGAEEALPQALAVPLVAAVCETTGDVAGQFAIAINVNTARALAALMLGGEPPAEDAEALNADELDAFQELGSNAASGVGSELRSALSCKAGVSVKSTETPEHPDKMNEILGDEIVFVSAEGTVGEQQTAFLLACGTGLCRSIVKAAAPAEEEALPPKEEKPSASLERILKIPVPVIVVLAQKTLSFQEVLSINESMVLEFDKDSSEPLNLLVNDRKVGVGRVVKVGERFGLRIEEIGDPKDIVKKL